MKLELSPIKVKCYSGYKANERPKSFIFQGKEYEIEEIESQKCVRSSTEKAISQWEHRVRLHSGEFCLLIFDEATEEWYIKKRQGNYLF